MTIPAELPNVRVQFMSARDFGLDSVGRFGAHYLYMEFEWDGDIEQEGDIGIEVWRER